MLKGRKQNFIKRQEAKQLNETKLKHLYEEYSNLNLFSESDLVLSNQEVLQLSDSSVMMEIDLEEGAEENSTADTSVEVLVHSMRRENESVSEANTGQTNVE